MSRINMLKTPLASCFLLLFFISCSPSIKPEVRLLELAPDAKVAEGLIDLSFRPYVHLSQVADTRSSKVVATYRGEDISTPDNVSQVVLLGFRRGLESQGFLFSDSAPVVLSVEVRKWQAEVSSGFSSRVRADAGLFVEVIDPGNKRIYSGTYAGHATVTASGINTKDLQSALRSSMSEAINQVIMDKQLVKLLSSY